MRMSFHCRPKAAATEVNCSYEHGVRGWARGLPAGPVAIFQVQVGLAGLASDGGVEKLVRCSQTPRLHLVHGSQSGAYMMAITNLADMPTSMSFAYLSNTYDD